MPEPARAEPIRRAAAATGGAGPDSARYGTAHRQWAQQPALSSAGRNLNSRRSSAIAAPPAGAPENTLAGSAPAHVGWAAVGRVRRPADRRRRAGPAATTPGSNAPPTAAASSPNCRSRRFARSTPAAGSARLSPASACRRLDEAMALLAELGLGAMIEIKGERRPRAADTAARRRRAASTGCGRRSCRVADSSFAADAVAGARRRRRRSPRACYRQRGARRLAAARRSGSAARRSMPTSATLAAGDRRRGRDAGYAAAAPIPSTRRRGRRHLFAWGVAAVFTDCPDVINADGRSATAAGTGRAPAIEPAGADCEAAESAGHFRPRGAAAGRRRQGHLGVERRKLGRLGGVRRRRHVLRRQCRQLRRRRRAASRSSITAAPGASATRS